MLGLRYENTQSNSPVSVYGVSASCASLDDLLEPVLVFHKKLRSLSEPEEPFWRQNFTLSCKVLLQRPLPFLLCDNRVLWSSRTEWNVLKRVIAKNIPPMGMFLAVLYYFSAFQGGSCYSYLSSWSLFRLVLIFLTSIVFILGPSPTAYKCHHLSCINSFSKQAKTFQISLAAVQRPSQFWNNKYFVVSNIPSSWCLTVH